MVVSKASNPAEKYGKLNQKLKGEIKIKEKMNLTKLLITGNKH